MIDLNKPMKAETPKGAGGVIPEGTYNVKVLKFPKPWSPVHLDKTWIKEKDEKGRFIKEDGRFKKAQVNDYDFHELSIWFEVEDGPYEGQYIFDKLSTHEEYSYRMKRFLGALGEDEMAPADIPSLTLDARLKVQVVHNSYDKEVVDPNTGLSTTEKKTNVKVIAYLPADELAW